jgi:hypothetical protein
MRVPAEARGAFGVRPMDRPRGTRFNEIVDGLSQTFALGDAAGGSTRYLVRDLKNPAKAAIDVLMGQPALLEQAWCLVRQRHFFASNDGSTAMRTV